MLLSKYVFVKVDPINYTYFKNLGYDVKPLDIRRGNTQILRVQTIHLHPDSNKKVCCKCNICNKKYIQRYGRDKEICYSCRKSIALLGNTYGSATKGRKVPHMQGENHPRWNPLKSEYKKYASKVRFYIEETYKKYKDVINPDDYTRTLCGIENGYQLDHRISIKRSFLMGLNPKIVGSLDNLQMLSWKENRTKHYK